jgi:hypothetical protein
MAPVMEFFVKVENNCGTTTTLLNGSQKSAFEVIRCPLRGYCNPVHMTLNLKD